MSAILINVGDQAREEPSRHGYQYPSINEEIELSMTGE
jgi:hypothetical protein